MIRYCNWLTLLVIFVHVSTYPAAALDWRASLPRIQTATQHLTAIQADFVQSKDMKLLIHPLISKGSFYFELPDALRWEYQAPVQSILLIHNDKTRRYVQINGRMTEQSGPELAAMSMVLDHIRQWFAGQFEQDLEFITRLEPMGKIILEPKAAPLARMIAHIEIQLAKRPGVIRSILIRENADTATRIEFQNVRLNPVLEDTLFSAP